MKKKKISLFDFCNYLFMIFLVCIVTYPLYFTVIASFSDANAVANSKVWWYPVGFNVEAYKHVFANEDLWRGYANTIFYTVVGTLFNLFLTIPSAYALSKKKLPGLKAYNIFLLISMYFSGGMIPFYLLMKGLGLINSRAAIILSVGVNVSNVIVSRTFFSTSIPESLYEAAEVDGASETKKMLAIGLPLSKPIIAVMTLYYAVGRWNDYMTSLLYITNKKLEPLQAVLRRILILNENALDEATMAANMAGTAAEAKQILAEAAARQHMAYTMKFAVVFIASAPLLIAYPFVQKYFVKGMMIGSVKE